MSEQQDSEQQKRAMEVVTHTMTQMSHEIARAMGEFRKAETHEQQLTCLRSTIRASERLLQSCTRMLDLTGGMEMSCGYWTPDMIEAKYGVPADQVVRDILRGDVPKAMIDNGTWQISWYDVKHLYARGRDDASS